MGKKKKEEIIENEKFDDGYVRMPAVKNKPVTQDMWKRVNPINRELAEEFLTNNPQLSPSTLKQYVSALRQFFWFVYENLDDKPVSEIKKRDYMKYRATLVNQGLSSSAISFKESVVSSFCNFIDLVTEGEDEFRFFKNFTKGMPNLPKNSVYGKVAITQDEYNLIIETLAQKEDYLVMAWVATAFNLGARRAEIVQLKTEILDYPIEVSAKGESLGFVFSHMVRGKGQGIDGKPLQYMINEEALHYMRKYVESRDFKSEYIFATFYAGKVKQLSPSWANYICTHKISPILNRRINPHAFKASAVTRMLEQGHSLSAVSKYIAHHDNVSTTSTFYDLRDDTEERDKLFK